MDDSSRPAFPSPPPAADPWRDPELRLSRRQVRTLVDLAWLAGVVIFLVGVWRTADRLRPPPPSPAEPLPFERVAERYPYLRVWMTVDEVVGLLGVERYTNLHEPEFDTIDRAIESRPDRPPGPGYWAKWADPADPRRWVAVYIARGCVAYILKRGVSNTGLLTDPGRPDRGPK